MADDRHGALKRWEKARQWAAMRSEADLVLAGPPAWCRVKTAAGDPAERLQVFVVLVFSGDLSLVKIHREPFPDGLPGPYWLARQGILWPEYLPEVVRYYRSDLEVSEPFRLKKKIGATLLDRLAALPANWLPGVFTKMRESGILPGCKPLTKLTCPSVLVWENRKSFFQDFKEAPGLSTQG